MKNKQRFLENEANQHSATLRSIREKIYPLIIEGIDGFPEIAIKANLRMNKYKKFCLLFTITIEAWEFYRKNGRLRDEFTSFAITKNNTIYQISHDGWLSTNAVSKKEAANKITDLIMEDYKHYTTSEQLANLAKTDWEEYVRHEFISRL